jgi:hypothetical protein
MGTKLPGSARPGARHNCSRRGTIMSESSQDKVTPEEMREINRLSRSELEVITQCLCEPPLPSSDEERRDVLLHYLLDGGSIANLRM